MPRLPAIMKILLILAKNVRKIAIKLFPLLCYFTQKLEFVSNTLWLIEGSPSAFQVQIQYIMKLILVQYVHLVFLKSNDFFTKLQNISKANWFQINKILILNTLEIFTRCCLIQNVFQFKSELTVCSCLNIKELLDSLLKTNAISEV